MKSLFITNKLNPIFCLTVLLTQCQFCLIQAAFAEDGVASSDKTLASSGPGASAVANPSGAKIGSAPHPGSSSTTKSKNLKSNYIQQEPQSDPAGNPTRLHRPGLGETMPPTAPSLPAPGTAGNPMPMLTPPPAPPAREKFPSVGQLEQMMFGHSSPNIAVENRLDKLEIAIFQKSSPDLDIERRIHRLKDVIVGTDSSGAVGSAGNGTYGAGSGTYGSGRSGDSGYMPDLNAAGAFPPGSGPYSTSPVPTAPDKQATSQLPFFENYGHYDLNQVLTIPEAEKFAVDVINEVRSAQGLGDIVWDDLAFKIAQEHVSDLAKRRTVSHQNEKGYNPDLRYSFAGGTDALVESTVAFPQAENLKPTRQLVVKMLETLYNRQDDREAMLLPHANGFAMAFQWTADKSKLVCVTETLSKHSEMDPIPLEANVGDKIEVKGTIKEPYRFHKLTVAWEGPVTPDESSDADEALPYFPPLDYEAHAVKSSRDFEKGIRFLQIAGITAAIAGGLFIPPVALAAPLIAASVGATTPKPVSEIPIRGGVKTDGNSFSHRVPLNNQGKEGIYYVTVWAANSANEIVPVSRRAIIARKEGISSGSDSDLSNDKNGNELLKDRSQPAITNSYSDGSQGIQAVGAGDSKSRQDSSDGSDTKAELKTADTNDDPQSDDSKSKKQKKNKNKNKKNKQQKSQANDDQVNTASESSKKSELATQEPAQTSNPETINDNQTQIGN